MITVEREILGQIMSTDVYISISSNSKSKENIETEISSIITKLEKFENKFSRFIKDNFLDKFNSSISIDYDEAFAKILKLCSIYYKKTNGIFDPTILPFLLDEGYSVSKKNGFVDKTPFLSNQKKSTQKYSFNDIFVSKEKNVISKPLDLKIDLGGIGKGFIADKISNELKENYEDFCISIGGDMYLNGVDRTNNYPYWAIEIESPFKNLEETPTLLLKNLAVATSGIDKRTWEINGQQKNHIIDTKTHMSLANDLLSVTVISSSVTEADIIAKTLLILGLEEGSIFCENHSIPAIFIKKDKTVIVNNLAKKYVWKE